MVKQLTDELSRSARAAKVEFFVSDYDIQAGEDWRQRVLREIRRSNLLLLVYTDPSYTWDWCLYEAGLFTKIDASSRKPIVVLFAGSKPPGPLHNPTRPSWRFGPDPAVPQRFLPRP